MSKVFKRISILFATYQKLSLPIKAGIWFTLCSFLQKGISFITIPIFTRIMSIEQYGVYSIYLSWHSILTIFGTLHLSYYVFDKGMVKYSENRNEFVVSIQSLSMILGIILFIIYFLLYPYFNSLMQIPSLLIIYMLIQILFEPPVLYWIARKRFEYDYQSVLFITIIMSIINPLFGILLIKSNIFSSESFARVFSISTITVISGLVFGTIIILQAKRIFCTKYWNYALYFNIPLIPHYLSTTALASADRIMIGNMIGKNEAGLYSVANSLAMAYTLFCQSFHHAYLPWLYSRIKSNDFRGIQKQTNFFLFIMLGLITLSICFAPEIIFILGSSQYSDSVWVIPPVCGSIFFIFLRDLFANVEYYFEKTKLISLASISVAVLNIVLNYLFIQRFGYISAGFTTLFCYIILSFTHFFVVRHVCFINGINYNLFFDVKSIFCFSCLMIFIIFVMLYSYQYTLIRYFILSVVLFITFFCRQKIVFYFKSLKT